MVVVMELRLKKRMDHLLNLLTNPSLLILMTVMTDFVVRGTGMMYLSEVVGQWWSALGQWLLDFSVSASKTVIERYIYEFGVIILWTYLCYSTTWKQISKSFYNIYYISYLYMCREGGDINIYLKHLHNLFINIM